MSLLRQFQPNQVVASAPAQAFQLAIEQLPDPQVDPKAYRSAIAALNDKFSDFLRLKVQVNLVELSEQDPDEFMKVMPKILDNFIPKMKSVEAKVDAVIDNRIYVETAYREPVPVDALKRAGVVIDSEVQPVVQESIPDEQSPGRPMHSHPAPSVALPDMHSKSQQKRVAALASPAQAAILQALLDDEDVLS